MAVFYKSRGPGVIDTLLAQKGLARRQVLRLPHFTSVPYMVANTDLIATVPERVAVHFGKHLNLQALPLPITLPPFRLSMLWHERVQADAAHKWLRGLIAETAAKLTP